LTAWYTAIAWFDVPGQTPCSRKHLYTNLTPVRVVNAVRIYSIYKLRVDSVGVWCTAIVSLDVSGQTRRLCKRLHTNVTPVGVGVRVRRGHVARETGAVAEGRHAHAALVRLLSRVDANVRRQCCLLDEQLVAVWTTVNKYTKNTQSVLT
jgi:hypothetical protein